MSGGDLDPSVEFSTFFFSALNPSRSQQWQSQGWGRMWNCPPGQGEPHGAHRTRGQVHRDGDLHRGGDGHISCDLVVRQRPRGAFQSVCDWCRLHRPGTAIHRRDLSLSPWRNSNAGWTNWGLPVPVQGNVWISRNEAKCLLDAVETPVSLLHCHDWHWL